jgi:hypothetical protein
MKDKIKVLWPDGMVGLTGEIMPEETTLFAEEVADWEALRNLTGGPLCVWQGVRICDGVAIKVAGELDGTLYDTYFVACA